MDKSWSAQLPDDRPRQAVLVPILMTALAAGLALVPIAMSAGEAGSEIQAPMAMILLELAS